jgi:hypothetical protein
MNTEYSFTLPCGYVTSDGAVHRTGVMRLATAFDEVEPLQDPRTRANEAFMAILLLSRVVRSLGTLEAVTPEVIGGLFSEDFAYLEELYVRLNRVGRASIVETCCPVCRTRFELNLGETSA